MTATRDDDAPYRFHRLVTAVRRQPERYGGGTIGEFASFLADLYWVCAEVSGLGMARDEAIARSLASRGLFGSDPLIDESERSRPFSITDPAVARLLAFWDDVDSELGLFRGSSA